MATTTSILSLTCVEENDAISPSPFNNAFTTLDGLGVDYIVDTGDIINSSGTWTYRKWNSGKYECWSKLIFAGSSESGLVHCGNIAYPVTFASSPIITASIGIYGQSDARLQYVDGTTSGADIWMYKASSEYLTYWVYIYVEGNI